MRCAPRKASAHATSASAQFTIDVKAIVDVRLERDVFARHVQRLLAGAANSVLGCLRLTMVGYCTTGADRVYRIHKSNAVLVL